MFRVLYFRVVAHMDAQRGSRVRGLPSMPATVLSGFPSGERMRGVCVAMLSFQCNQGCLWPGGEGDGVGTWEEPLIVGVNSVPSC